MRSLSNYRLKCAFFALLVCLLVTSAPRSAQAATAEGPADVVTVTTRYDFKTLLGRLEESVVKNNMLVVAKASASAGAEKRGVKIAGDAVVMVFRNDFAVRMLQASTAAGLEAPIPIHVYETSDGGARIAYRRPTAVFRPYHTTALTAMARELDPIFEQIVSQAAAK